MLTLTRKEGESLILITEAGERIKVMLSTITDEYRARISVEAPQSVTVIREELELDWEQCPGVEDGERVSSP